METTLDKMHREAIAERAGAIKSTLVGNVLYGVVIDPDDVDALVVAAYECGRADQQRNSEMRLRLR